MSCARWLRIRRASVAGLFLWFASWAPAFAQSAPAGFLLLDLGPDPIAPRGWPLEIRWLSSAGPNTNSLIFRSESGTELSVPITAPGRWWLSPEQTRSFPVGIATARVGQVEVTLRFSDVAEPLSAEQQDEKYLAEVRYLLATGQAAVARQRAEAWIERDPEAPGPRALLGETLVALNLLPEALGAYDDALRLIVWPHPPEELLQRANQVRARLFAQLPTRPVDPEEPEPTTLEEQDSSFGADPRGQWAVSATASSEYRTTDYSASRATGAPDVVRYGDSVKAWASRLADSGLEWLELTFPRAVQAVAVRVRQVFNPGAIVKVEVYDAAGVGTTVFDGMDTNIYPRNQIGWFIAKFPRTTQPVQRLRITLDSARVEGWNEIDAVQLVEAPPVPPDSVQITSAVHDPSERSFTIIWTARVGARYDIQRSSSLRSEWTTIQASYPASGAAGNSVSYRIPIADDTGGFYRVVSTP